MILVLFLLFSALSIILAFRAVLGHVLEKRLAIARRMEAYLGESAATAGALETNQKLKPKTEHPVMGRMTNRLKEAIDRITPVTRKKELETRLREAGYPLNLTPIDFWFLQGLVGVVLFLGMYLLLIRMTANLFSGFLFSILIAFLAMYYMSFSLSAMIKKRRQVIQKSMPDFFDMVTLSIEAGMGLDASLLKVCNQTKGPLAKKFLQTMEDMKLGKSRREAFSDLRTRVPVHQFQSIITALIQADMLGVGMTKVLRSLTARIREQRTQLAREQGLKAPVKMIFPMMLFIFPAIFIVMLGPMVIYLLEMF